MADPHPRSADDGTSPRNYQYNNSQLNDSDATKFVAAIALQIVKAIGTQLPILVPNLADQRRAARFVEAYFWKELGRAEPPMRDEVRDRFHASVSDAEPHEDVALLQSEVAAIHVPLPSTLNLISSNVMKLTAMLNLDSIEAKLLAWSYALQRADDDRLRELVYLIRFDSHAHKLKQLSVLFDEPVTAVERVLGSPCKVLALRFVDAKSWHSANRLTNLLSVTVETSWLMEYEHRSTNGMLTFLLEPEFDAEIVGRDNCTSAGLYESLPQAVAEAYELARRERPLNIHQLPAIIHWFTLMDIPPEPLKPLARKFMLEPLREVIKRCFVACGQANQLVTPFLLLKALYAAAE